VCNACADRGVQVVTAYAFSSENWRRPRDEVSALMGLIEKALRREIEELHRRGMRFRFSGGMDELPQSMQAAFGEATQMTAGNPGLTLNIAVNYGSRREIIDAVRALAERVARGDVAPSDIDEAMLEAHLYTAGLPDPDLLIRTAGEMRLSNFLLWQCAYTELYVTPVLWPDFDEDELDEAIATYARRERRFGMTSSQLGVDRGQAGVPPA
jgi:undecaprenyl diphosphate synthase